MIWNLHALLLLAVCAVTHVASGQTPHEHLDTVQLRRDFDRGALLAQEGDPEKAEPVLKDVRERAVAAGHPLWPARVDRNLGRMHCAIGNDSLGFALLQQAIDGFEAAGAKTEALRTYADLGWCEGRSGQRVRGITRLEEAEKSFVKLGDHVGTSYCMEKRASIYSNAGEAKKAIAILREAIPISERENDPYLGFILCELSHALTNEGEGEEGLAAAERATVIHGTAKNMRGVSYALQLQAKALNDLGRHEEALIAAQRSLEAFDRQYSEGDTFAEQAFAYLGMNKPREALERFEAARASARAVGNMPLALSLEEPLSSAAAATGDHKLAYEKLRHYYDFMKNCGMLDASNDIARMEMEHEFATKHLADSLELAAREAIALRDNELRVSQAHNTRNLVVAGSLLVLLIALGLWLRLRYLRRANAAILSAQAQLVESEKQRGTEQVRTRIARDMHDEIGSDLTKIGLLAAQAKGTGNGAVTEIAALATQVRGSLHDIVWAVDPRHDSVQALVTHAEQYTQRMLGGTTTQHELHFELKGDDRPIDPARKRNIFLLLKEALNNAVKYAQAERLHVALEVSDARFDLRVSDNGVGFDPLAHDRDGNGLRNMKARADALGAALEVVSRPGHGCTVRASGLLP